MKLDKHLIGLTGEYLVAGMMSMKGWVASLTLKNYPAVDIFGMNPQTEKTINIQVKTIRKGKNYPIGSGFNHNNLEKEVYSKIKCPYVFVHIDKDEQIRYFVVSANILINLLVQSNKDYLNKSRIKQVKGTNPIGLPLIYLLPYENSWSNLWI